jgi:hypothetical protein
MGDEIKCLARINGQEDHGKALLETSELIFRGLQHRLKIAFAEMKSVAVEAGELQVKTRDREFAFAVGAAAEKWRKKILHPKSRMEKLGLKAGMAVAVLGDVEAEFALELRESKAEVVSAPADSNLELVFWFVDRRSGLARARKVAQKLSGGAALWVVYPKGKKEITENDVLSAGRKARLKDAKVVGFSSTHTALKFVIPVEAR